MGRSGVSIYVLIDALGWEVVQKHPFLTDVLTHRQRVETVLGYSCGAIPSLLTGATPREHGHWNLFYRSAQSPFRWTRALRLLPRAIRESRVVRRGVKEISQRSSGYSGYFAIYNVPIDRLPHYDICERSNIYEPGGLAPTPSVFDVLRANGVDYECYTYHDHSDEEILSLVPRRVAESPANVFFLYLSHLDAVFHESISQPETVRAALAHYDERLRAIYRSALERDPNAQLTIFSDHGMTPIQQTVDLMAEVTRLGLRTPDDYLPAFDSTMARFWVRDLGIRKELEELLAGLGYGRVLEAQELTSLGIDFADDRYGDLIFLMNPGCLICPSDMGRVPVAGMHGFHPREDPHAYAVFLSTVERAQPVRQITDILPTIRTDLDLR